MPQTLLNNQYDDLILQHIIRPYQIKMGVGDTRIKSLTYSESKKSETCYYYPDLVKAITLNKEWFDTVIDRLSRIYSAIDFSFFREDDIALLIKFELISKGVKSIKH